MTKRGSHASDARDMVFAVSGIATKPQNWKAMSITYEKSAALVFMRYAIYNACGVRIREHPITREKIMAGLKAKGDKS